MWRSIRAHTYTPLTWMPHFAQWRCSQRYLNAHWKLINPWRIAEDEILRISLLQPLLCSTMTSKGGIFWLYLWYLFAFHLKSPFSLKIRPLARWPHHFWASCVLCVLYHLIATVSCWITFDVIFRGFLLPKLNKSKENISQTTTCACFPFVWQWGRPCSEPSCAIFT